MEGVVAREFSSLPRFLPWPHDQTLKSQTDFVKYDDEEPRRGTGSSSEGSTVLGSPVAIIRPS